jgi:hypothetical protein
MAFKAGFRGETTGVLAETTLGDVRAPLIGFVATGINLLGIYLI